MTAATAARLLKQRCRATIAALPTEGAYVIRIVVAAAVSWQVCVWLGASEPPVYAVIVPLVAMRDAPHSAFSVSIARLVGVVAGLSLGVGVLSVLHPAVSTVALVLALALILGIVLRIGGSLNIQVAVSALLVFANSDPSSYAVHRLWETAVGAGVTIVLSLLLWPTDPVRIFLTEVRDVAGSSADNLILAASLIQALGRPATQRYAADIRRLRESTRSADATARSLQPHLATARKAIRVHPLWRRRYGGELAALMPTVRTAAEVTTLIRLYAEDIIDLAGRAEARTWSVTAGRAINAVVTPLAEAVALTLTGRPAQGPLGQARDALALHTCTYDGQLSVIARRPLRWIIATLAEQASP